jgi:prepilin signal peptidase PulO-like enzyme (type II secretory pathway)
MVPWWRLAVLVACSLPITFFDVRDLRIPDVLSLGGSAALVLLELLVPGRSATGLLVEAGVGFGTFALLSIASGGRLGLGDAKYSLLIALALGLAGWLAAIAVASVAALAVGLVQLRAGRRHRETPIPFAPYLGLGAAVASVVDRLVPGGLAS